MDRLPGLGLTKMFPLHSHAEAETHTLDEPSATPPTIIIIFNTINLESNLKRILFLA